MQQKEKKRKNTNRYNCRIWATTKHHILHKNLSGIHHNSNDMGHKHTMILVKLAMKAKYLQLHL